MYSVEHIVHWASMLIWGFRCCHMLPTPLALLGSSLTTSYGAMQPTICFSLTKVSLSFTQDILLTHHFSYATDILHRSHCTYLPDLQLQSIYMPLSVLPDQVVPCELGYSIRSPLNSSGISAPMSLFPKAPPDLCILYLRLLSSQSWPTTWKHIMKLSRSFVFLLV